MSLGGCDILKGNIGSPVLVATPEGLDLFDHSAQEVRCPDCMFSKESLPCLVSFLL